MKEKIIYGAVAVALAVAAVLLSYNKGRNDAISAMKPKVDTLVVFDTIREEIPVPVTRWRDKVCYVEVPAWDTLEVHHHDTTFLALPLEHKEYRKPNYYAKISGYNPNLDYIETYQETKVITETKIDKAPKWSFGVSAGWGLTYGVVSRSVDTGPTLMLGVTRRF